MLRPSDRAPGLLVGDGVSLPPEIELGGNVVIHDGTVIGGGTTIQDGAVLGKPPMLGARSKAVREQPAPLVVGDGVTICAAAVIAAGAAIGPGALIGDQAYVRERSAIGRESTLGRGSCAENDVLIGSRVRIQSSCYIAAFTEIEDDVFLGPGVTTANDMTAGRRAPSAPLRGPRLRRAARIGAGAVILPEVEIGEEAFVGAGAVVTRDVSPRTVVAGVPARPLREVPEAELMSG